MFIHRNISIAQMRTRFQNNRRLQTETFLMATEPQHTSAGASAVGIGVSGAAGGAKSLLVAAEVAPLSI
jgi:hypothetical protein